MAIYLLFSEGMSQKTLTQLIVYSWTASVALLKPQVLAFIPDFFVSEQAEGFLCRAALCALHPVHKRGKGWWVLQRVGPLMWYQQRVIMILESPLAAYFLPHFRHLPPLGQHRLSLDFRARPVWHFLPWRDLSWDTKSLWVKSGWKSWKPSEECDSKILGKEKIYLGKWIFIPPRQLLASNYCDLDTSWRCLSECSSRFLVC